MIETPVYLTSTMAVGRMFDGAVAAAVAADPAVGTEDVVIPVVAECDDSWLSRQRRRAGRGGRRRRARSPRRAAGRSAEGAVGAGTGMVCFDWKGGIGTASRVVPEVGATVGVLVLANFGDAPDLRVDGVPVGRTLGRDRGQVARTGRQLHRRRRDRRAARARPARRGSRAAPGSGSARTGSVAHHGSGEIFLAFATAGRRPRAEIGRRADASFADAELDPLFAADGRRDRGGGAQRALGGAGRRGPWRERRPRVAARARVGAAAGGRAARVTPAVVYGGH